MIGPVLPEIKDRSGHFFDESGHPNLPGMTRNRGKLEIVFVDVGLVESDQRTGTQNIVLAKSDFPKLWILEFSAFFRSHLAFFDCNPKIAG